MNGVVEVILRRRSVREGFEPRGVSGEVLEDILRCGMAAPSSKNARPWRFHVVTDAAVLSEIAALVESAEGIDTYVPYDPATGRPRPEWQSTVLESAAVLRQVPVAVFVENRGLFSRSREALVAATADALAASITGYTLEVMGLGAAVQNMWLAAVACGLSGVFMGDVLIAQPAIQRRLGIEHDLVGVLALGYAQSPGRSA
jgi:nitroreductase